MEALRPIDAAPDHDPRPDEARVARTVRVLRVALGTCLGLHAVGQLLFWLLELDPGRFR